MAERVSDKKMNEAYSYIYSHAVPNHSLYGAFDRRAQQFHKWIKENVPVGNSIIDVGCGRGFLLRWLIASGYKATGTEIADWLMEPGGDLCGMPVTKMYHHELHTLPDENYDVAASSDVIEHLQTEEEAEDMLMQLVRISRGPVLVSSGGLRQAHNPFPQAVKFPVRGLHFIIHPKEWWLELYEKYCVIDKEYEAAGSYFMFGHKKLCDT